MFKHEAFYYLFYSVGWCCNMNPANLPPIGDVYHVVVCRAESITGPYYDTQGKNCVTESGGTTILASHGDVYAPGGQDVLVDPESGRTVIVYHYCECAVSGDCG